MHIWQRYDLRSTVFYTRALRPTHCLLCNTPLPSGSARSHCSRASITPCRDTKITISTDLQFWHVMSCCRESMHTSTHPQDSLHHIAIIITNYTWRVTGFEDADFLDQLFCILDSTMAHRACSSVSRDIDRSVSPHDCITAYDQTYSSSTSMNLMASSSLFAPLR
jgi:hypothetical protein